MKAFRKLTLRLAASADAAPIAVMSRELIETGLPWSWTPARVARNLRQPETLVLTARDGAVLAGFAIMQFGEERAHLSLLAVRPEYRRQGIARRMLDWLSASALTAGIASIHLELRAANLDARSFYLKLGFAESARITGYYQGRENAVRMSRDIRVIP